MTSSVRGFHDILGRACEELVNLEKVSRDILGRYGYKEVRIPTVEFLELFQKSTGETTDVVEKEMFLLAGDQRGRSLTLRPEGTPGVVRMYLQNNLHMKGGAGKLFYIGPMFRAERPQADRYREFVQVGVEYLGNPAPSADAEVILALAEINESLGLGGGDYQIHLNTLGCPKPECRPAFRRELLNFLISRSDRLCENCRKRIKRNPFRALDCKTDSSSLQDGPRLKPCRECQEHFKKVAWLLSEVGKRNVVLSPQLVRGLDYYTRTVFEFKSRHLGAQDAIAAGGRYDDLVHHMGGPRVPAVGWALGAERTLKAAECANRLSSKPKKPPLVFVAVQKAEDKLQVEAMRLMQEIRKAGILADGGLFSQSLKSQLRQANQSGAHLCVIVGEEELGSGMYAVRDMKNKSQDKVLSREILSYIKSKIEG